MLCNCFILFSLGNTLFECCYLPERYWTNAWFYAVQQIKKVKKEMNTDVKGTMDDDTDHVTKEKIKEGKKYKRCKHENESVKEKIEQRTDKEEQEVNSVVRDKQGNVIPPCSGDVTQESVSPTKKAKKQKHLNDLITADIVETKDQEKEIVAHVEDWRDSDVPPSAGDITEGSTNEKEKKAKKHKHKYQKNRRNKDIVSEKTKVKAEIKREIYPDVKEKLESLIPPTMSDITEGSSSRKKRKKAKKQRKNKTDSMTEKMLDETEGKEKEIKADVHKQSGSAIFPSSRDDGEESGSWNLVISDPVKAKDQEKKVSADVNDKKGGAGIRENSDNREKREKAKNHKYRQKNDFMFEEMHVETEGKEVNQDVNEKRDILLSSTSDVTEKSRSRQKKDQTKNHKQQSDLVVEDAVQTKGQKKEENAGVKIIKQKNISPSCGDLTEKSSIHEKTKKARKHKHKAESYSTKKEIQEETKCEEKEVNKTRKEKLDSVFFPGSSDVTGPSRAIVRKNKVQRNKSIKAI